MSALQAAVAPSHAAVLAAVYWIRNQRVTGKQKASNKPVIGSIQRRRVFFVIEQKFLKRVLSITSKVDKTND
jgi:hypothetical protein